jgi:hypothetical protein
MARSRATKIGRPPIGDAAKSEVVRIRVTKRELAFLKREAKKRGVSVAALLRISGGLEA